jgi:hypothetical protein
MNTYHPEWNANEGKEFKESLDNMPIISLARMVMVRFDKCHVCGVEENGLKMILTAHDRYFGLLSCMNCKTLVTKSCAQYCIKNGRFPMNKQTVKILDLGDDFFCERSDGRVDPGWILNEDGYTTFIDDSTFIVPVKKISENICKGTEYTKLLKLKGLSDEEITEKQTNIYHKLCHYIKWHYYY